MYPAQKHLVFTKERNLYIDPIHNTACKRHFTCSRVKCPKIGEISECYMEHSRYQPQSDTSVGDTWYIKGVEKINRIGLNRSWLALLIIIIIFSFFAYMLGIYYRFYTHR